MPRKRTAPPLPRGQHPNSRANLEKGRRSRNPDDPGKRRVTVYLPRELVDRLEELHERHWDFGVVLDHPKGVRLTFSELVEHLIRKGLEPRSP